MSLPSLILGLMSDDMKKKMEADWRKWIGVCPKCAAAHSIWDIGGIRYNAAGRKRAWVRCPSCQTHSFRIFEKATA